MRAMTLLKNSDTGNGKVLPLRDGRLKIYLEGIEDDAIRPYATVSDKPESADIAIIRIETPWYPVETRNPFAQTFHHGDLIFKGDAKRKILELMERVPTIVVIYLDRPAVIPDIVHHAAAVIADFGASDEAVARVLFGKFSPEGNLPFELPSSMSAVERQLADVPSDSDQPLFRIGFGLRYE
jgi:beta-glucosidase